MKYSEVAKIKTAVYAATVEGMKRHAAEAAKAAEKRGITMKRFTIWINEFDMGVYEGVDEANALDQYARDAGYENWAETAQEDDEVTVFEV